MDKMMDDYLNKIDRYLRPMAASERADIINEIKSEMIELQTQASLSDEQILERLGNPKELAKAYLGESIAKSNTFSLRRFGAVAAFYSLAGFTGMFVLPFCSVLAVALMFSGMISPIAGIIEFIGFILGVEVPFVSFQMGTYTAPPYIALPLSVVFGIILFLAGKGVWKIMIKYIQAVSLGKRKLQQ